MPLGFNGGVIGLVNASTRTGGAPVSGMWSLSEVIINKMGGLWPEPYTVTQVLTTSQTWTPPSGVNSVDYFIVAAGGGGGSNWGGGGGGGGVLIGTSFPVTPSQSYTATIGAGGNANADRKSTRLNSSHSQQSRMPSSA